MDPAGLPALEEAIRHMHGCEPTFVESVPVRETFNGATVWEGEVQVGASAPCVVKGPGRSKCTLSGGSVHAPPRRSRSAETSGPFRTPLGRSDPAQDKSRSVV